MCSNANLEKSVPVISYVETTVAQIVQVYLNNVIVTLSKKYGFDPHEAKDYINSELSPEPISSDIDAYEFADDESGSKTKRKRQKVIDNKVKQTGVGRKRNSNKVKEAELNLDFSKITLSAERTAPVPLTEAIIHRINKESCSYIS